MQNGNIPIFDIEANTTNCEFCQRSNLAAYILKETPAFLVATDHAPLVEGHLLIITKQHYACYGAAPAELDGELKALKREVQQFLAQYYAPAVFWEHGIFRQTVYHAHLHCFPFGTVDYDLSQGLHDSVVHAQEDIRRQYASQGMYFYMENNQTALLFAPEMGRYWQVIKTIFAQAASRNGKTSPRSPQQRREEGVPLIEATIAKWRLFQQQGASYVDKSDTR